MGRRERKANARTPDSLKMRLLGIGLAGVGAAHFTAPGTFDPLTEKAFPHETRTWTYRNGASELLIGLALAGRRTRSLGSIGLVAYIAFLVTKLTSH